MNDCVKYISGDAGGYVTRNLLGIIRTSYQGRRYDPDDPLVTEDDYQGCIDECWKVLDTILADDDYEKVMCIFNTIFACFDELENNERRKNVDLLNRELAKNPDMHTERKLEILVLLFNQIPTNNSYRPRVFKTILELARAAKKSSLLEGRLTQLPAWINGWK